MTQMQLDRQIARITGEPLSTVNTLGFSVIAEQPDDLEPEDVELVLDCPFCRRPVPYPGPAGDGSETLAECDRCDVYFDVRRSARSTPDSHGSWRVRQSGKLDSATLTI